MAKQKYYTIREFCEIYKISRSYFYVLSRSDKTFPIIKLGTKTLIEIKEADKWMKARIKNKK